MRNKDANRQVLKAISIGLSAALSLMPTVTVFADDDVDTGENTEHHEESSSNESHESSEESASIDNAEESVSEASEAIDTAESYCESTEGTSDGGDLFSSTVYNYLETSQGAVGSIGQDLSVLEGLNQAVEAANEGVADALGTDKDGNIDNSVVSMPVGNAEKKVEAAADSVKDAKDAVDDTSKDVKDSSTRIAEAADAEYENTGAAQAAKDLALQELAGLDARVASDQQAVNDAEKAVNDAQTALNVAQGAVDKAADALKQAQDAEKAANDKLDELKKEWDFEIVNGEVVFGETPADENRARAAIDSVTEALAQAQTEASEAADNLVDASISALEAAKALQEAAKEKAEAAQTAYGSFVDSVGQDRIDELDGMLADIEAQRAAILEKQENGEFKTINDFYTVNRNMAFSIVKYMLAQNPDIDSSSIRATLDKGNVKKVNGGFEVKYEDKDGVTHTEYYNYKALYRDGDEVDASHVSKRGYTESDHMLVLKIESDGTQTAYISEVALNNGLDTYQSLKDGKTAAEAELEKANNLNDAKALLDDAVADAEGLDFLQSPEYKDRVNDLIDAMAAQRDICKAEFDKDNPNIQTYWKNSRILARYMVEYKLLQRMYAGEIDSFEFKMKGNDLAWENGHGVESNYGTVYVTKDGVTTPEYFDYIAYYDDGEVVNGAASAYNSFGKYGKTPDHIVVVTKGDIVSTLADGSPERFDTKGEDLISIADVLSDRAKVQKVESARRNLSLAAIEQAKQKVIAAVKALDDIKVTGAASAQKFNELQEALKVAQDNYQQAVDAFGEAETTLNETKGERDVIEQMINDGFNKIAPAAESSEDTGSDDGDSEDKSEDDPSDPSAPAATPDTTGGALVDIISTDAQTPSIDLPDISTASPAAGLVRQLDAVGSAEASGAGASDIESGVLPEDGLIAEGDVLGQRMAPIVDAVENGTFSRSMMFTEDGLKVPFMWWIVIVLLGAKGVQVYMKKRREKVAAKD